MERALKTTCAVNDSLQTYTKVSAAENKKATTANNDVYTKQSTSDNQQLSWLPCAKVLACDPDDSPPGLSDDED